MRGNYIQTPRCCCYAQNTNPVEGFINSVLNQVKSYQDFRAIIKKDKREEHFCSPLHKIKVTRQCPKRVSVFPR